MQAYSSIPSNERLTIFPFEMDSRKIYYVYIHIDSNGIPFYVGKGKGRRAWNKRVRNVYWKNIVKTGYTIKILESELNEEMAFIRESYYIGKYQTRANFKLSPIGTLTNYKRPQDIKDKVAIACKRSWTKEKRDSRREQYLGNKNPFYGKKHTDQTKENLKKYHFRGIECLNSLTGENFLVSGTRNASELTRVPRQTIMRLLKFPQTKQKIIWRFKRLEK